MTVSLLNVLLDKQVRELLDHELLRDDIKDEERGFTRDQTLGIIHAALWAHSARGGSFANAYAMDALFSEIGLQSWEFKKPAASSEETPVGCTKDNSCKFQSNTQLMCDYCRVKLFGPHPETGRDDETCTTCKGTGWDSELEKKCDCV